MLLCLFLPYINMNQLEVYICLLPLEPVSYLPPHPTPLGCHRGPDLGSLSQTANFHRLSIFTYGNIYVSMLLSQSVSPSPSHIVSTSLFCMFAPPLLPIFLDSMCIYVCVC